MTGRGPATIKKRRSWLGLLVPALLAFAVLVALGTWQIERKTWKEGLIAALTERLAAPPTALPAPRAWPSLDPTTDEYRRVKFSATFDHGKEALVYAAGSAFRPDVSGPGYWIFTPARLADGDFVMVDRGFVPEARKDPASRADGQIAGPVEIVGVMRWPDPRHWFSPADDPAHNLMVHPRPGGDRRRQGRGPGCAVLCRAGIPGAAARIAAAGEARGQPPQQPPAICGDLVRSRAGSGRGVRRLGAQFHARTTELGCLLTHAHVNFASRSQSGHHKIEAATSAVGPKGDFANDVRRRIAALPHSSALSCTQASLRKNRHDARSSNCGAV